MCMYTCIHVYPCISMCTCTSIHVYVFKTKNQKPKTPKPQNPKKPPNPKNKNKNLMYRSQGFATKKNTYFESKTKNQKTIQKTKKNASQFRNKSNLDYYSQMFHYIICAMLLPSP